MLPRLFANATREQLETHYALGMLRKEALKDGVYYQGRCRNARVAIWHEPSQQFIYWRVKFTVRFLERIKHPEDENNFDVFLPEKEITQEEALAAQVTISAGQLQEFCARSCS